jgi:prepilin-type N-terminal cleavage/methylation domain-containing protein
VKLKADDGRHLRHDANNKHFKRKGGKPMNRIIKRHSRGEKGFTLVELLIVFTLLAVLAAIMIPNVSGFVAYGHTQSAAAEKSVVQTAMDSMMAKANLSSVNITTVTSNMAAFPDQVGADNFLYPNYLRTATTKGTYSSDNTGLVSQVTNGY